MKEALENAIEEMKRVDHLFYVSLKYTRTVDMIRHCIDRLISSYEFSIEALVKLALEKKQLDTLPHAPIISRAEVLKKLHPGNEIVQSNMQLVLLLLKLRRAKFKAREEFRRHVTMIATLDSGEIVEVKIDTLGEYYAKAKEFLEFTSNSVHGKEL